MLPLGAGPHMFGLPGLRLPHLQKLYLSGVELLRGEFQNIYLTRDDVASIASCCGDGGSLKNLSLLGVVRWDDDDYPDYSAFSSLTTLTSLSLTGCVRGVDTLASLRSLCLSCAEVEDETLAGVAKLTRLAYFYAWDCQLSERAACAGEMYKEYGQAVDSDEEGPEQKGSEEEVSEEEGSEEDTEEDTRVCQELSDDLRRGGILPRV